MTSIHVQPTFDLGTRLQKMRESAEIDTHLQRFLAEGGRIQVLDNTGRHVDLNRHETNRAAFERRNAKKGVKA